MAGVPMWIPHGMVALGFGLILIIAVCAAGALGATNAGADREARPSHDLRPRRRADRAAAARLPDLPGAADRGDGRAGVLHERAAGGAASEPVRLGQRLRPARHPVLHLCRRVDGARQRRAAAGRFRAGRRRLGARQPRRDDGRHLGDLRRDLGRERRDGRDHRQGDGAGDAARRLSGDLHRRPDHRGRRDRRDHPAQHSDDRLRRGGARNRWRGSTPPASCPA